MDGFLEKKSLSLKPHGESLEDVEIPSAEFLFVGNMVGEKCSCWGCIKVTVSHLMLVLYSHFYVKCMFCVYYFLRF